MLSDVDECSLVPGVCVSEASCTNIEGGFSCQCPFANVGDGRSDGNGCTGITYQILYRTTTVNAHMKDNGG